MVVVVVVRGGMAVPVAVAVGSHTAVHVVVRVWQRREQRNHGNAREQADKLDPAGKRLRDVGAAAAHVALKLLLRGVGG
jgi:hypothetical protein